MSYVEIPNKSLKRLREAMALDHAPDIETVVRRALATYETIAKEHARGQEIVSRSPNGDTIVLDCNFSLDVETSEIQREDE